MIKFNILALSIIATQFYQDTLEVEEPKEDVDMKEEKTSIKEENDPLSPSDTENAEAKTPENGDDANSNDKFELDESSSNSDGTRPKGVLVIHSKLKNRTKKSVQWRTEDELEMYHFFELDETERGRITTLNSLLITDHSIN